MQRHVYRPSEAVQPSLEQGGGTLWCPCSPVINAWQRIYLFRFDHPSYAELNVHKVRKVCFQRSQRQESLHMPNLSAVPFERMYVSPDILSDVMACFQQLLWVSACPFGRDEMR